jgi:hypothetical protein
VRSYLLQTFVLAQDFKLLEKLFILVLKTKKVKTVTELTTNQISRTKLIYFKELISLEIKNEFLDYVKI